MKSVRKMITLAIAVSLAASLACGAAIAAESNNKDIRVEKKAEKISLTVKPGKKSFAVDEPISFNVKVNKPAYIYIFSIGSDNEKVTLLYPNQHDSKNKVVPSKKGTVIPGMKAEFKSDREGIENVVVLASAKELILDPKPQDKSKFFSVLKGTMEKSMKDIRVEAHDSGTPEGDVKEIKVTIKNK